MKLALVIGRFQPLHNGHVDLIMEAKDAGDKVLVLVGSTNKLPDFKNPFSYEERKALLEETFGSSIEIRPLPDRDSDDEWTQDVVAHVLSIEEDPTEVMVFCSDKDEAFYRKALVFPVTTVNNVAISATEIRESWYTDDVRYNDMPTCSALLLEEHKDHSRLTIEYATTLHMKDRKTLGHPFGNPMEPVSFAVIIQNGQVLVGRRAGPRGAGQLGLAGGFVENTETTLEAAMRETKEELGLDLKELIKNGQAVCMAQAVSENLGDLGVRTLGVNYLFVIKPDAEVEINVDSGETTGYSWVSYLDICEDKTLLFFNHNQIVRQLLSKIGGTE
jgi:bifunctional NMN adenylyltransferase/nudix hydrolase